MKIVGPINDDWPDLTAAVNVARDGMSWPVDGATMDLKVVPCGDDAWEVRLVIWGPEMEANYDYRALEVPMADCAPTRIPVAIPVREVWQPRYAVESVAMGIAHGLAMMNASVTIDWHPELPKSLKLELECENEEDGFSFATSGCCSWDEWVEHVHWKPER